MRFRIGTHPLGATGVAVTLAASLLAVASPGAERESGCAALVVTKAKVAYRHERSIQAAVNKAMRCDWVLVAPGVYSGSVVIRTPDLHVRGLDRNRVVIDGRHRKGVNGIEVRASDVWVENLTVRNFDRTAPNAEHGGNEVWWYEADAGTVTT